MRSGLLVTLIILAWGIWGLVQKKLITVSNPIAAEIYVIVIAFLSLPLYFLIAKQMDMPITFSKTAVVWAVLTQILAGAASLLFVFLLWKTSSYWAIAATAAYPVVTLILGVIIFKETVSLYSAVGVLMIVGGLMLLNLQ